MINRFKFIDFLLIAISFMNTSKIWWYITNTVNTSVTISKIRTDRIFSALKLTQKRAAFEPLNSEVTSFC